MTELNHLSKVFKGTLILNWKTGSTRVTKKKPVKTAPFEIPVSYEIKVNVPEQPNIIAKGEVDIQPYKVNEMFIESL